MISQLRILLIFSISVQQSLAATDTIVCYYASWGAQRPGNGRFLPEDIDPTICTHVNYAFVGLDQECKLAILDEENDITQEGLKRVAALKEINPNLKVLFSVGGATAGGYLFGRATEDPALMQNLVNSAIDMFQTYNFDGLDVDWEYPYNTQVYNSLLQGLRDGFQSGGYLLTAAVNSIPGEVSGYDIPTMSRLLDIINVMTYDFHAMWVGYTAENSPLYGGNDESDWNKENRNADAAIRYWVDGGADPQKVTIGIAFYGHSYILSDPGQHSLNDGSSGPGEPGPYTDNLGTLGYNEICEFHQGGTTVYLDDMKVPYLFDGNFWIGYDNEQSVAEKVNYAKQHNLAGVMIWSIETDDLHEFCGQKNGLLKAVGNAMRN